MDFKIPPIGGPERTGPTPRSAPAGQPGFGAALDAAVNVNTLPSSPPPSVLDEMDKASRVADALRAQKRELHFEPTASGRVVVQVRDLDGNVIRTIPPAQALDIAAGAPLHG
ncbi:MAG: hypothetical protein QOC95_1947 [Thermoleophilaceae bacterium]|jgi:flagellar protein FlaG|nr:hypothetical protein [Thermoleophilaceae bacterium]